MFRKTTALILAITMVLCAACAAAASGNGVFGELAGMDGADERLSVLEEIAVPVSVSMTTDSFSIEVTQVYCEEDRIYIAYQASGNGIMIHDGLELEDDGYADIIAGEETEREDGTIVGWKECVIPEDDLADTLTASLVFRTSGENDADSRLSFTLERNRCSQHLRGSSAAGTYQAEAEVFAGKVDLKGTVSLISPEQAASWIAWQEGAEDTGMDVIACWNLYQNGEEVAVDLYGASQVIGAEEVFFEVMFPFMEDLNGLSLVPEYSEAGEKPEEAIVLEPVIQE